MDPQLVDGFTRQRRALVATSIVLAAFVGLGAAMEDIEFLGNTVHLAKPLAVALPLWITWGYSMIRYYQYFRDLGDVGFREAIAAREGQLARKFALHKLRAQLRPDVSEFRHPKVRLEVRPMDVLDMPPSMWRLKANGWLHVTERFGRNKTASQMIENEEVTFPPWHPRFARLRSFVWTLVNTRFGTEYGLPFLIGLLPLVVWGLRRAGLLQAVALSRIGGCQTHTDSAAVATARA
jgi:hypothetical protein